MAHMPNQNNNAFLQAVSTGNCDQVIHFLNQGADIDVLDLRKYNALRIALELYNLQCGQLLIDRGADIWVLDPDQDTILMKSIKLDNRPWIEMIINKGLASTEINQRKYFFLLSKMLPTTHFNFLKEQLQFIKFAHPLPAESLIRIALRAGVWQAADLLTKYGGYNMLNETLIIRKSLCKEIIDANDLRLIKNFVEQGYKLHLSDLRNAMDDHGIKEEIKVYLKPITEELTNFHQELMRKKTAYDFLWVG